MIRRVGLDIDPGWVPWLGRIVTFHYPNLSTVPQRGIIMSTTAKPCGAGAGRPFRPAGPRPLHPRPWGAGAAARPPVARRRGCRARGRARDLEWPDQAASLLRWENRAAGPLRRFADFRALKAADLFLVGLAAACEGRRAAALGVMTLQAPFAGARPSVHLALDLVQELFDAGPGDAMALASGSLVDLGLSTF